MGVLGPRDFKHFVRLPYTMKIRGKKREKRSKTQVGGQILTPPASQCKIDQWKTVRISAITANQRMCLCLVFQRLCKFAVVNEMAAGVGVYAVHTDIQGWVYLAPHVSHPNIQAIVTQI